MIAVTEAEFGAVFWAAHVAKREGQTEEMQVLDKLARKINADVTRQEHRRKFGPPRPGSQGLGWKDVPSVFEKYKSPNP